MEENGYRQGNIFSASFKSVALTTNANDLFTVYASTNPVTRVEILSINLSVGSSAVTNTPQVATVSLMTGTTSTGAGAAITPTNLRRWANAPTAGSAVNGPTTTVGSSASATQIWADGFNIGGGYLFPPYQEMTGLVRPVIASGQRLTLRLEAPSTALVMSGSICFREIGGGNAS